MKVINGALLVMNMGLTLRRQRDARHWSQEKLAEVADLNRSYIGELERGEAIPSLLTLLKLAHALDTTPSLLLQEAEAQERAQTARDIFLTSIAC
jgi:XRE family transcriptional regulator, regulator of sulfur utilization